MQRNVEEFTIDEDDINHDAFELGRYDEEEDLFSRLQQRRKIRKLDSKAMLRFRCCAGIMALFRPSEAVRSLYWVIFRNILLILVYYALSIGLTFYQNHLLKEIHFPLSVVLCHLVVKFLLASSLRLCYEWSTGQKRVLLDCNNWLKKLSLIGISGGLDIGFSNWGQEFITVSLYTMAKSTAIIFILGFALFLKLEEKHWSLFIIVGMISGGLCMFTYKSTQFNVMGFSLIMAASFLSGLRWSMCQLIVQKSKLGLQNPIDMVYHVQPWMIIAVLPFALFFEGELISNQHISLQTVEDKANFINVMNSVLIGALMAFFMEIAEYLVVSYTSSLTLSVAGIFKEICTLCLAVIFNGDQLTFINFIGLVMCFTGIISHVGFKFFRSTKDLEQSNISTVTPIGGPGALSGSRANSSGPLNTPENTRFHEDEESETPLLGELEGDGLPRNVEEESDDERTGSRWTR